MKFRTVLIAVIATLAAAAGAQMSPVPKEIKDISWMTGKWEGDLTMSFGGQDSKSRSTMSNEMVVGGRYLRAMVAYTLEGFGEMTGSMMVTYNADKKKWVSWYFDSQGPDTLESTGELTADTLVLTSKPAPMAGQEVVFRTSFKKISDTKINFHLEMKQGSAWVTMMKGDYTKK